MLSFKPAFSLSFLTFIKRFLSSSLLSIIRVVSAAYLRLLILLPAILIPACAYSSPAFFMMYSAYNLNKQGDNIQPWRTPFPILNQFIVPRPVLTVASWPAYRFCRRQVKWSDIPIFLKIFYNLLWCSTVKGFNVVNEAEVDVLLKFSCFSKSSLNVCKFLVHVLLNPGLENFEHYFASVWDECNCVVMWAFFGIVFIWDWNENWPFPVLWPLLSFLNLLA